MVEQVTLTRKELYDQVWSEPMTKLAKKYALSDVGLAKICRRYNIPCPTRGWWAQKQAGYRVAPTPLPQGNDDEKIRITVNHERASDRDRLRGIAAGIRPKRPAAEKFHVSETLTDPHPLVVATADILASATLGANGLVSPPRQSCLNVHVSPESRPRALRIMDALIKALGAKGFEVTVSTGATKVLIQKVPLPISLSEGLNGEQLRARDHNLEGHYEFGYDQYAKNVPSGKFQLKIDESSGYSSQPFRQLWRDTENQRLEDILYTFVSGLVKTAATKIAEAEKKQAEQDHEPSREL